MSLSTAISWVEILVALALAQSALEHLWTHRRGRWIFAARLGFCALTLCGVGWAVWGLLATGILALQRFNGPYNGGSDRMALLVLFCLSLAQIPNPALQEIAMAYLAVQLVLSYVLSGWVKLRNRRWRSGAALADVFAFSVYPVSRATRGWADRPVALWRASWAVILLELVFPLALLHPAALGGALVVAAVFHLSNALSFGLNRFLWIWIAAYPALIWFQGRVFGG